MTNSTSIVWEDTFNGFKLFQMNTHVGSLQKLVDYLGGSILFDGDERDDFMLDNGREHTFDYEHIFTLEYLDDEFKQLSHFSVDG